MLIFPSACLAPCAPQAFDDCTTLSSTFKLLDSFEGLLEREAIAAELAKKQVTSSSHFCLKQYKVPHASRWRVPLPCLPTAMLHNLSM